MDQVIPRGPVQSFLRFRTTEIRAEEDLCDSPNPFLSPRLTVPTPQCFPFSFVSPHNSILFISEFTVAIITRH